MQTQEERTANEGERSVEHVVGQRYKVFIVVYFPDVNRSIGVNVAGLFHRHSSQFRKPPDPDESRGFHRSKPIIVRSCAVKNQARIRRPYIVSSGNTHRNRLLQT